MRSIWRQLLLVLLSVALPVQAFAAAGAVHCARMHERVHAAAVGAAHDHHAMVHSHHEMNSGEASTTGVPDDASPLHAFKCSACAACCVAVGLPVATPSLTLAPGSADLLALSSIAIAAFVTGGLERPPRTDLA